MSGPSGSFLRRGRPRRRRPPHLVFRFLWRSARVTVLAAVPLTLAVWMLSSPRFVVRRIVTGGSEHISADWVREVLEGDLGSNIVTLELDRVQRQVMRHPWALAVQARKELPDRLRVSVEERQAVAVLEEGQARFYVDGDGRRIVPVADGEPVEELLRLGIPDSPSPVVARNEAASLRKAMELEERLRASFRGSRRNVRRIEVIGDDDFRIHLDAFAFPVLVRGSDLEEKVTALSGFLPEILERVEKVELVDLRFSGRIVVRPGEIKDGWQAKET